jgi:hypothetical protein
MLKTGDEVPIPKSLLQDQDQKASRVVEQIQIFGKNECHVGEQKAVLQRLAVTCEIDHFEQTKL